MLFFCQVGVTYQVTLNDLDLIKRILCYKDKSHLSSWNFISRANYIRRREKINWCFWRSYQEQSSFERLNSISISFYGFSTFDIQKVEKIESSRIRNVIGRKRRSKYGRRRGFGTSWWRHYQNGNGISNWFSIGVKMPSLTFQTKTARTFPHLLSSR